MAEVVIFVCPDKRRRDCGNYLKCLNDALQYAGAVKDDTQIVDIHAIMFKKEEVEKLPKEMHGGGTHVVLYPAKYDYHKWIYMFI